MKTSSFYLIVSGSRHFSNAKLLEYHLNRALGKQTGLQILIGGCNGCDALAEDWVKRNQVPYHIFLPEWHAYGRAAGPIRNKQMVRLADGLLAFPIGVSKGTRGIIAMAQKRGLPTRVVEGT
ncbi:MAG: DUF2493 domain-containing protein [Flavobacteriaceae bacterium]|nr:DUF2493 domain-containing protein [Flavobacteriaceae bacterium]